MSERRVGYIHALRNALIPLVALLGVELPGLVSGGLVVEVVFSWPGVGLLTFQRALQYDYTIVMGTTTFVALLVVGGNLMADLLYSALDPRVRRGRSPGQPQSPPPPGRTPDICAPTRGLQRIT